MSFSGFPTSKPAGSSTTAVKSTSGSIRPRLTPESYKLVWVCASQTSELAAAKLLLDEEHDSPITVDPTDQNLYSFGKMSGHNIILAKFPPAPTDAAAAAVRLKWKFKGVTSAIVVGIAGAAPGAGKPDLRLGDIVVGVIPPTPGVQPALGAGLKPYDSRRVLTDGPIYPACTQLPSKQQQTAVLAVRQNHSQNKVGYTTHLSGITSRHDAFKRPKPETDILFKPTVSHASAANRTCDKCPKAGIIARSERKSTVVHYGPVGSGGLTVAEPGNRDAFSAKLGGALCFETESAGVVSYFPCLAIRGLANYADSHGVANKTWDMYAAAAAAAYAKELLAVLPQ
ncbi:hypothetical protein TWF730_003791 [Orbilia blumenaviensis]|uniref:Nucleoside phosphorylase domain-containing protein n=1 Tax=Orbilia blumenaviensis TaxID=1796055 RepID=A0AAV9U0C0_9PEZI